MGGNSTIEPADLMGGWRLESWSFIYDDGRAPEFPLGPDARGLILYTSPNCVSAALMRAGRAPIAPNSAAVKAEAFDDSFAYAGRFEIRGSTVFHSIEIATNPALIGLTTTRHIDLRGELLTLSGPDFSKETARSQQIVWRRL
jgi:hypothetical protein